jgi:sugar phosphate isomerase/epimerase
MTDSETRSVDVGIVSDEISRNLEESLDYCDRWGIRRIELREGSEARFPAFTARELELVETALRAGTKVTAVSPGILKCNAADEGAIRVDLERKLPQSVELAQRFGCPIVIAFGFEKADNEPDANRLKAMRAFERAAELCDGAGLTLAIENEPNFWVDDAEEEAALFEEIDHPRLGANWDPCNSHWGGVIPTYEGFSALKIYIVNVHVKDLDPGDPEMPWRAVGEGETPWDVFLPWVVNETEVPHVTIETHGGDLVRNSKVSLDRLREMLL